MPPLFTYKEDLFVPPLGLWLDPGRKRGCAFISHAHADHTGRHKTIVASPATARILRHRLDVHTALVLDYGVRTPLAEGYITLFPAGHILGSAQALVEYEGERLVYTGDFKLKASRTAEPCRVVPCDHLVMECTYGRPQYRFPDRETVEAELLGYLEDVLRRGEVPVVLAYVLGRAQEMLRLLAANGFHVAVENRIYEMARVYEELGIALGDYERFDPEVYEGKVLIFPPHLWNSAVMRSIPNRHPVAVTGWAVDGRQRAWYRSRAAFPISDHADFDELLDYIEQARPRTVYLVHGFRDFADHLRGLGVDTRILGPMVS